MSVGTLPRESSPDGYGLRDPAQLAESLSPTPPNSCVPPLKRTKGTREKPPSRRAPPARRRTAIPSGSRSGGRSSCSSSRRREPPASRASPVWVHSENTTTQRSIERRDVSPMR